MSRWLKHPDTEIAHVHYCQYGAPYLKPTVFAGSLPGLSLLSRYCSGGHCHERLAGTVTDPVTGRRTWRTTLAGRYPPALCRAYAAVAVSARPDQRRASRRRPRHFFNGPSAIASLGWVDPFVSGRLHCPPDGTVEWQPEDNSWGGIWTWVEPRCA